MNYINRIIFAIFCCMRLLPTRELLGFTVLAAEAVQECTYSKSYPSFRLNNEQIPGVKSKVLALREEYEPRHDIVSFQHPQATTGDDEHNSHCQSILFLNHVCTDDQSCCSEQDPAMGEFTQMNINGKEKEKEGLLYKSIISSLVDQLVYWIPLIFSINLLSCIYDDKSGLDDDEPYYW
eukprot:scaffold164_cov266-Chaetoceros_neogracile.AAC.25